MVRPLHGAVQREVFFHHARAEEGSESEPDPAILTDPEQSLLPELLWMASAHGTRLVFLRTPEAPRIASDRKEPLAPREVWAVGDLIERNGHTWLDHYHADLPNRYFANARHMTEEGAAAFTRQVGPELRAVWESVR